MKQGVLRPGRASLLLSKGHSCYRSRRTGERKRKTVRGCIVGSDIAALSLVLVKQGENDIPGLTDTNVPKRLGPKRASKIRKLFVCIFPYSPSYPLYIYPNDYYSIANELDTRKKFNTTRLIILYSP